MTHPRQLGRAILGLGLVVVLAGNILPASASGSPYRKKKTAIVKPAPPPYRGRVIAHRHPVYRPVTALPVGHTPFSTRNRSYFFHNGHYYWHTPAGYVRIGGPLGHVVTVLPTGYRSFRWDHSAYSYYGGTFYRFDEAAGTYTVVIPPIGAEVPGLPEGAETIRHEGITFQYAFGVFYRYNPLTKVYVVTHAPLGAVVKTIPYDFETRERDGREVYVYNGVTYEALGEGDDLLYRVI
jgi:hypothetical protein